MVWAQCGFMLMHIHVFRYLIETRLAEAATPVQTTHRGVTVELVKGHPTLAIWTTYVTGHLIPIIMLPSCRTKDNAIKAY